MQIQAQTLKELKEKATGGSKPKETESNASVSVSPGDNQFKMAEAFFASGSSYSSCRFTSSSAPPFMESAKITRDVFFKEVKKDENGQIIGFKGKSGSGTFQPNHPTFPVHFDVSSGGSFMPYIFFIGEYAICTTENFAVIGNLDKGGCSPWEIYCADKSKLKALDCVKVKAMLKEYLTAANAGVESAKANEKAAADKLEADKRAKFTTQGKDIVKIRIECASKTLEQNKSYTYTVIATLKNGEEISTATGGYIDEFEVKATGLPATYAGMFGESNTVNGTMINVPFTAIVTGDKVVLTVKSKYYPTMSATVTFNMDYSANQIIDYNGDIDMYNQARHGGSLKIEIKSVVNAVTGVKLLEYKIFSKTTGDLLKHFKINETSTVSVLANGKNGKSASQVSGATNGSNGGSITIVLDPSVKSYNLNVTNAAGIGGKGGYGYSGGSSGAEGKVEKIVQKLTW